MKRSPLRRISDRRMVETDFYRYRIRQFLLRHPYCQVWLSENGVSEDKVQNGVIQLADGRVARPPLATEIHHRNKRRGSDLLDQTEWLAVSREAHERIEGNKTWARAAGYLKDF